MAEVSVLPKSVKTSGVKTKYGKLTVLKVTLRQYPRTPERRSWAHCRCQCGELHGAWLGSLKSGNTTSCGCVHRKNSAKRCKARKGVGWKAYKPQQAGEVAAVGRQEVVEAVLHRPEAVEARYGDFRPACRSFSEQDIQDLISVNRKIA